MIRTILVQPLQGRLPPEKADDETPAADDDKPDEIAEVMAKARQQPAERMAAPGE